jgi:hypothetical protein
MIESRRTDLEDKHQNGCDFGNRAIWRKKKDILKGRIVLIFVTHQYETDLHLAHLDEAGFTHRAQNDVAELFMFYSCLLIRKFERKFQSAAKKMCLNLFNTPIYHSKTFSHPQFDSLVGPTNDLACPQQRHQPHVHAQSRVVPYLP